MGRWSEEENRLLVQSVNKIGRSWIPVSQHVKTRTPKQCKSHYYTIRITLEKEKEEAEEREKRKRRQKQKQKDLLKRALGSASAAAASTLSLDDIVKGRWSEEEERKLLKGVKKYGNHWMPVSEMVKTRLPKQCKARYYSIQTIMRGKERDRKKRK